MARMGYVSSENRAVCWMSMPGYYKVPRGKRSKSIEERASATMSGTEKNTVNALGQPIGYDVPGWTARPRPPRTAMEGRFVRLEMLDADKHAADLFAANAADKENRIWTYLPYGPYSEQSVYRDWVAGMAK